MVKAIYCIIFLAAISSLYAQDISKENNSSLALETYLSDDNATESILEQEEMSKNAKIMFENFLRQEKQENNALGIMPHYGNYFMPISYTYTKAPYTKTEVKFQLSFKKALFENILSLNEKYYFAYTQTSWWQLYSASSPFRETNYQPEVFIDIPIRSSLTPYLRNLRFGFVHESNGKSEGQNSRSWNRIYLGYTLAKGRFVLLPRFWYRIPEPSAQDDNKDITKYAGKFDMGLAYIGKKYILGMHIKNNLSLRKNRSGVQLGLSTDIFDNGMSWFLQYYNGYAESLIDYNRFTQKLSFGFLFSY